MSPDPIGASPSRVRRRLRITLGVIAVALLCAGTAVATTTATSAMTSARRASDASPASVDGVSTAGFPSGGRNPGIFTDNCTRTRTADDDPIMMPGMTGMSMGHDFFGNERPSASSTSASLVGAGTSCSTSADASAYWTPVVRQNGTILTPVRALVYWRAPAASARSVHTMPAGITMIAGNELAAAPQDPKTIDWTCTATAGQARSKASALPHDCATGQLRLIATFPNCWDGHTLDGHQRTNVVYADASGVCPASHPIQIPQIVFHVAYPTNTATGLTLSTGPTTNGPMITGHVDFMDGWTQGVMDRNVAACIDTQTRCGPVSGAQATPRGGRQR